MNSYRRFTTLAFSTLLMVVLATLPACNDDDEHPNEYVNNWIEVNMDFWYYWNTSIPSRPDKSLAPDDFFESLLNHDDRFSWIQDNYRELLNSLQGINKEAGYELVLYRENPNSPTLIAQIVYVKPDSPAEDAGLKRGDVITQINGQQITTDNYRALLAASAENHSIAYRELDLDNQDFLPVQTKSLTTIEYAENPNFLNKIFTYNDRKIGYYVYNLFSNGPTSTSTTYTTEMDQIFASFQSAGITDLIIDLRFNSGGAESATVNLASLVGKDVDNTKVFSIRQYNLLVESEIKKDPDLGAGFLDVEFVNKSQNIGNQLTNNRVYILTGSRTASASELLINGLRPYMDVFLIGSTTVGKNVGSISLFDEDNPRNTWGMQPIVTKAFNSLKESDYSNGFVPQISLSDNNLIIYPLGDERELLLARALQEITGISDPGRARPAQTWGKEIGHSLDLKKRSNVLMIDEANQQELIRLMNQ